MNNSMEEQFNLVSGEYDAGRRKFIPCFDDYYEKTTALAAEFVGTPQRIADLGTGTGLLTMYYFRHFPNAEYILVDIADKMLEVAQKRFYGAANIKYSILDYSCQLPSGNFDLFISALSIHHLENEQKQELFKNIRQKLSPGGWFINYDQFSCASPFLNDAVNRHWIAHLFNCGLSEKELTLWQERRKLDRECSITEEIAMLEKSGFKTNECIYQCGKFAVIAAQA